MNWKLLAIAACGILVGVCLAPVARSTALASGAPTVPHFQLRDATVDEPTGQGQDAPRHEVFLLNTDSGQVWKFQGLVWGKDAEDGKTKVFSEPTFVSISVAPPSLGK